MASAEYYNVQVLYQLSWEGKLEHPHMITVQYPSDQEGLRLRDVKKRLATLRGHGIGHYFSWSYKRNYKNTFIWSDLSDDDVIHPLGGSGEHVLKASQLIDAFANKPAENRTEYKNERKQSSFMSQLSSGVGLDQCNGAVHRHSRTMSVDMLAVGAEESGVLKKDERTKEVAIDVLQSLPPLSVEQETIDVEKSDFCLSSSDNEISPRPAKMADSKPLKGHDLVVMTKSPTVQGLQTPSNVTLPTEVPSPSGSAKRLWKREIKKSLFRTRNTSLSPLSQKHEKKVFENATSQVEVLSQIQDSSLWRDSRSKSVSTLAFNETIEKEKEAEQSPSQLIRTLWTRWTGGGSSKGKRSPNKESIPPTPAQGEPELHPEHHPAAEHSTLKPTDGVIKPADGDTKPAEGDTEPADGEIAAINILSIESPQPDKEELRTEQPIVPIPTLQVVFDSPAIHSQGSPPETEVESPKPAIARVELKGLKNNNGLPKLKTTVTSPKCLPPGFHKGTNDTKPVQTPRRSYRSSIPLASPPLKRSLSKLDSSRSFSGIGAITGSPEDSATSTLSPQKAIHAIKKCINFRERDERPLIPGVTTLDWEKALQEADMDCLPPPNFREILQECTTCGRTFKPDSLQVHKRGCHLPQYARAFSLRASPHMLRSRAP